MPYIRVELSQRIESSLCNELCMAIGEQITCFPGKTEQQLMIKIDNSDNFYLGGRKAGNSAFISVKLYGYFEKNIKEEFANKMFVAFQEILGISNDQMYITFEEYGNWGSKGILKSLIS